MPLTAKPHPLGKTLSQHGEPDQPVPSRRPTKDKTSSQLDEPYQPGLRVETTLWKGETLSQRDEARQPHPSRRKLTPKGRLCRNMTSRASRARRRQTSPHAGGDLIST